MICPRAVFTFEGEGVLFCMRAIASASRGGAVDFGESRGVGGEDARR